MCNTVIPGRYCECGQVLETFDSYVEPCVVITQGTAKKEPEDCGEMKQICVPIDWGMCPGGCSCSVSPVVESPSIMPADPTTTPTRSRKESSSVATSESSAHSWQTPASTPPATESKKSWATSDENETRPETEAEKSVAPPPPSSKFASRDVPDLLSKLIHAVEDISTALQNMKSQMGHAHRAAGAGGGNRSNSRGGGRVIIVETPTDIDSVVKLVLHRQYTAEGK